MRIGQGALRRMSGGAMMASVALVAAGWVAMPAAAQATAEAAPAAAVAEAAPAALPRWSPAAARQLARIIQSARAEGLRPADYDLRGLANAIEDGDAARLDQVAEAAAMRLAHDYYFGRVSDRDGFGWHVDRRGVDLAAGLHRAAAIGDLDRFYRGLLPDGPRYAALRAALADAGDGATRDRIRANMERWRWMPRAIGDTMIYVNVPSYRLAVIDRGATTASYTVVVGAPDTPTPWLATEAPSLVVHPWWSVPDSIAKKVGYKLGYRQPPGPRNALGQIKINLVNDQAIYLHDTPAKWAFGKEERALSHGCVRVKDISALAASLMEQRGAQFHTAMAGKATATMALPRTWPVYLVYFTIDQGEDGRLTSYGDPYDRDAELIARLDGPALQVASN